LPNVPTRPKAANSYGKQSSKATHHALIDTNERMANIYRGTKLLAAFPITHGKDRYVPVGHYTKFPLG